MANEVAEAPLIGCLQRIGAAPSEALEVFDHLPDVLLWLKDAAGRYQWVNLPFVLNFGLKSRLDLLGRTDFDICSLPLANQYRLDDERVLQGERILARVELVGRFDHTARWCSTSKLPLRRPDGHVVGTVGITYPLPGEPPVAEAPLSRAIRYISEHYAESITHRDLANACGLSIRTFERQFMATYHISPHDYIRQLRVRMSCNALVFTRKSLAKVATDFGFSDQSHFTREFRRLHGETPLAYRNRFK
jgi:AraC-like DNA-binding protein